MPSFFFKPALRIYSSLLGALPSPARFLRILFEGLFSSATIGRPIELYFLALARAENRPRVGAPVPDAGVACPLSACFVMFGRVAAIILVILF